MDLCLSSFTLQRYLHIVSSAMYVSLSTSITVSLALCVTVNSDVYHVFCNKLTILVRRIETIEYRNADNQRRRRTFLRRFLTS